MRFDVELPDFRALADSIEGDIARAATEAMRATAPIATQALREQVTSAGLGQRLANTWRWRAYPDAGKARHSLQPAGYIWTRAPDIIDSFIRGAKVVPLNGRRFLAIPTEHVPRAPGARGSRTRMTPEQVEFRFNQDLILRRGKQGRILAFVNVVRARNRRSWRAPTKGRIAQGRAERQILMFTLVPTVRLPKLLELDTVAAKWSRDFEAEFNRRLS